MGTQVTVEEIQRIYKRKPLPPFQGDRQQADCSSPRQQLGLPTAGSEGDRTTIAKLEIGSDSFFWVIWEK